MMGTGSSPFLSRGRRKQRQGRGLGLGFPRHIPHILRRSGLLHPSALVTAEGAVWKQLRMRSISKLKSCANFDLCFIWYFERIPCPRRAHGDPGPMGALVYARWRVSVPLFPAKHMAQYVWRWAMIFSANQIHLISACSVP